MRKSVAQVSSVVLNKLAAEASPKRSEGQDARRKEQDEAVEAAGTGAVKGIAAQAVAGGLGLLGIAPSAFSKQQEPSKELVRKLTAVADTSRKIPTQEVPLTMMSHYMPEWGLGGERIGLPKKVNPFVAAHEVGHGTGRRGLLKAYQLSKMVSPAAGLGLLAHAAMTGRKGEDMPWTGYAAPIAAAVGPGVVQAEELRATLRAKKLLDRAKINVPGLKTKMVGQQLGYLLGHAGAVAPFALGAYGLHRYLKGDEGKADAV